MSDRSSGGAKILGAPALLVMGIAIALIGIGFVAAYHGLRGSTPAEAAIATRADEPDRSASPLSELGIDPEESGLSPEAAAAIERAQRAASRTRVEDGDAPASPPGE